MATVRGVLFAALLTAVHSVLGQGCGERKVDYAKLILGGEDAISGQWPWHAAIFHRIERSFMYQCGGAIINQNTILTGKTDRNTHTPTTPLWLLRLLF